MSGEAARLAVVDPLVAELIAAERARQQSTLNMVASENFAPLAVREAQGSLLTNKYAVGYPGERHYDGCEYVDEIEQLAIDRCRSLFGAAHANVQPYSGSSANAAVLHGLCEPGDAVLGFDFASGGHPTQSDAATFAGRFYRGASYGVSRAERRIDLDEVRDLAQRHRPRVIFAGGACYPRVIDFAGFRQIADEVGAYLVCDMAHIAGLVAGGVHPSPVALADVCTMTVHKTLGGARGGAIICRAELAARLDAAVCPGEQGGPLLHTIAAKAVTFLLAAQEPFAARMARTVTGARTVAAAIGAAEDDTGIAVITGGTDLHLLALDTSRVADSRIVLAWLAEIGISANAVQIAHDPAPPGGMSGLRLGTTSLATRGFAAGEFVELGAILAAGLGARREARRAELLARTRALVASHPAELDD